MSALLPNIPTASFNKHNTDYKTLNPLNPEPVKNLQNMQGDQNSVNAFSKLFGYGDVISKLDSYSKTELKELKDKLILEAERINSLVKQIEAREMELDEAEDVELSKQGNCKITGQKRVMPISPERETKRKRKRSVKAMELYSMDTQKVEEIMMKKCGEILEKVMKHRNGWVFNEPVDVVALGLTDYRKIVKSPMDLGTVKSNLDKRVYGNPIDFAKDVRLTFDNALLFNRKGEEVYIMATVLLTMFNKLFDPAYKKFEVERQRVVVEHQKFGKHLAEIMQPQVVSSQQDSEKPMKHREETDKNSVSEQKRMVPEATENPRKKREMSNWERDQLGLVLQDLAEEYLDEILQIVAKRNSNMITPDGDGEIELVIEALDNETMWDLHTFVRHMFKAGPKNKAK